MIYPIVVYGSALLRKIAQEIPKDYPNLQKFVEDMFETMYVSDGVGLAAPQVGKSIRLFVIDGAALADDDHELADFKKAFINPAIIEETGEKWSYTEGCLSLPGIREEIKRPNTIRIQYYDANFQFFDETYVGVKARIIQHEYDHLQGILLIDRLSALRKKLLKGKLNEIAKGKSKTEYKTKVLK
jgi:peptide deformylase